MKKKGPCVPATTVCGYTFKRHRGERLRRRHAGREKNKANLEISCPIRESWGGPSNTEREGLVFPFLNVGSLIRVSFLAHTHSQKMGYVFLLKFM